MGSFTILPTCLEAKNIAFIYSEEMLNSPCVILTVYFLSFERCHLISLT